MAPTVAWLAGIAATVVTLLIGLFFNSVMKRLESIETALLQHLRQSTELATTSKEFARRLDRLESPHFSSDPRL